MPRDGAQVALVDLEAATAQLVGDARQIDRDARRRLDREAGGHGRSSASFNSMRTTSVPACWVLVIDCDRVLRPGGHRHRPSPSAKAASPARHLLHDAILLGCSSSRPLLQLQGRAALDPFAGSVLHDFAQRDFGLGDAR